MRIFHSKIKCSLIALILLLVFSGGAWAWTAKSSMQYARDSAGAGIIGDKFYVYGGYDGSNLLNTMEIYDPATNLWTQAQYSVGVRGITGSEANGRLYLFGGHFNNVAVDHFEKSFDPATMLFTDETAKNPVTAQANSVTYTTTVYGKEIFVFGGAGTDGNLETNVMAYNPSTKAWREVTDIPSAYITGSPAMGFDGTTAYLFGGQTSSGPSGQIISYNIKTSVWIEDGLGTLKTPRRFPTGHIVPYVRGKFYLAGGNYGIAPFPSKVVEVYDPILKLCWPLADSLPEEIAGHLTLVHGSDASGYTIYVVGGLTMEQLRTNKVWALEVDNGEGILPSQQAPDETDMNENGVYDNLEPARIKVVKTYTGDKLFGVELTGAPDGSYIESLQAIPASAPGSAPRTFPVGMFTFKISVPTAGASAVVTLRVNYDLPSDTKWYKWSYTKGWYDYTKNADSIGSRKVRIYLVDGGVGDADGTANGVIVDPIGPSIPTPVVEEETTIILPDSGGCFINAIFG